MTQSTQRIQARIAAQRGGRKVAEREARRQAFLAEAGSLLAAATPDESMMLAAVARQCIPFLGDWCVVHVRSENGEFKRTTIVHEDPERVEAALKSSERYPFDPNAAHGPAQVFRSGEALLYPAITEAGIYDLIKNEGRARELASYGLKSGMCVPIVARGRTLGVMSFAVTESDLTLDENDLAVAEELGRRVALAVDNARLVRELEKALEAKDEFLGLVSHELRTPVTAIYGGAHLLHSRAERLDRSAMTAVIADIETESERLFRMVENLLALARLEVGEKLETEPVLVQRVAEKLVGQYRDRKREVRLNVDGTPPAAAGRRAYVEHVIRNLVSNADKYSPEDGDIEVRVREEGDNVELSILDSGPGVAPESESKIFERFYRAESSSRSTKGAGLGLTVCKRLVEAQGGTIQARNRSEGGLEVSATLPVYREDS